MPKQRDRSKRYGKHEGNLPIHRGKQKSIRIAVATSQTPNLSQCFLQFLEGAQSSIPKTKVRNTGTDWADLPFTLGYRRIQKNSRVFATATDFFWVLKQSTNTWTPNYNFVQFYGANKLRIRKGRHIKFPQISLARSIGARLRQNSEQNYNDACFCCTWRGDCDDRDLQDNESA